MPGQFCYIAFNFTFLILNFINPANFFCQPAKADSLNNLFNNAKHDTDRLYLLVQLTEECELSDILKYAKPAVELADKLLQGKSNSKSAILKQKARALNNIGFIYEQNGEISNALYYYNNSLKISEEIGDKEGIATLLNNIGLMYNNKGDIHTALDYYFRSLKLREAAGDKKGIANSINNIAAIYTNQGDILKALNYFAQSLKIREQIGDKQGIAVSLNNIASIYTKQGDISKALDNYERSLKIREELGDKKDIANSINNIGSVYYSRGDFIKAMANYRRSLKLFEEINDKADVASVLNNIGSIYDKEGNMPMVLDYYGRSLKIREEIADKQSIANSLINLGGVYLKIARASLNLAAKQKNYKLALSHSLKSLTLSKELGFPENIRDAEWTLSEVDAGEKNYGGAFEHYKQYIIYRDSINNKETRKASIKNQLKYEYEKKEAVIKEQQEKDRAVAEEKNRRQQIAIWSVAVGLLLVIGFAGFVFRSLKTTRSQKLIIEEKQKEILDSINYAKRIQMTLIPSEKQIHQILKKLKTHEGK